MNKIKQIKQQAEMIYEKLKSAETFDSAFELSVDPKLKELQEKTSDNTKHLLEKAEGSIKIIDELQGYYEKAKTEEEKEKIYTVAKMELSDMEKLLSIDSLFLNILDRFDF